MIPTITICESKATGYIKFMTNHLGATRLATSIKIIAEDGKHGPGPLIRFLFFGNGLFRFGCFVLWDPNGLRC